MPPCAHPAVYVECLSLTESVGGVVRRFGTVPVCASCRRPRGEVKLLKKGSPKEFNATSWLLMTEHHPQPPYDFKLNAAGTLLVPAAYKEEAPTP